MDPTFAGWNRLSRVALVGNYLPRRCGIATFTTDLSESLANLAPNVEFWAAAMNDRPEGHLYPPRVKFEIRADRPSDYRLAADFLNLGNADIVCLQHEYGIFGGPDGRLILELLSRIRMPLIVTLHTVLKEPSESCREIVREMAEFADRLVVMSQLGAEFLREIYWIPEAKVTTIPHGIHDVPFVNPNYYKDVFGVQGKKVLLSFGLLSPSKGIEMMIDAMPKIVSRHPDTVYIVLGATHPSVKLERGEDYRHSLQRRAEERGVADHVIFHNKFVELQELIEFLGAADVYITPYLNEAQITSGTLAYAIGSGKAAVSTPYWYAQEMLADDRGKLVPFADSEALSDAVLELLENETQRHAVRKRAYQYARRMRWSDVATRYLDLFVRVQQERISSPRPVKTRERLRERTLDLPELRLDHLEGLSDDTGIFQHARFTVPRRDYGYCTDDNARALIVAVRAADCAGDVGDVRVHSLADRYLSFLEHALDGQTNRFRNFLSFDRRWQEETGSEDCHGRALWALGVTEASAKVRGHADLAAELFQVALEPVTEFQSPRAWVFCLLGIHEHLRRFAGDARSKRIRDTLAKRLYEQWQDAAGEDWPWIEDLVTYENGRLAQALLVSGRWMFCDEMMQLAFRSLDWLVDVQTSSGGQFEPVGTEGWYPRGGKKAVFDQQPVEAAALIDACLEAFRITKDRVWSDRAQWCFGWFLGDNDLRQPIHDQRTGGSSDGLGPDGINENQGAESTLSWLMSQIAMYDLTIIEERATEERDVAPPASPKPEIDTQAEVSS